jgi:hypothetical protein
MLDNSIGTKNTSRIIHRGRYNSCIDLGFEGLQLRDVQIRQQLSDRD